MSRIELELKVLEEFVSVVFENIDRYSKIIEDEFNVNLILREETIKILGEKEAVEKTEKALKNIIEYIEKEKNIDEARVTYTIELVKKDQQETLNELKGDLIIVTNKGKQLKAKTLGQQEYVNKIRKNDIVFGIGPAGTGKTYLAIALAIKAFKDGDVEKIILTRPALEAGESLGFLPGDLQEKIDPYLRPLYDALFDIMGPEAFYRYKEKELIEVAPLAYMRGRTLEKAFIILDEGQNTTKEQMKMFLTRLGNSSKMVITGDVTQIDLPKGKESGLREASKILKGIKGIEFNYFEEGDIVRNKLVMKIVRAYDEFDKKTR